VGGAAPPRAAEEKKEDSKLGGKGNSPNQYGEETTKEDERVHPMCSKNAAGPI